MNEPKEAQNTAHVFYILLVRRKDNKVYFSFHEGSQLPIIFDITESSGFAGEELSGEDTDREIELAFSPTSMLIESHSGAMSDNVRRWFIGITLKPVITKQFEVSEKEVQFMGCD